MHADDNKLLGVFLLQLGQVWQRVDAVDAAKSPEIEDDDFALEVLDPNGAGRVQPGDAAFQFGGLETAVVGVVGLLGLGRLFVLRKRCGSSRTPWGQWP